jgi:protein TonB
MSLDLFRATLEGPAKGPGRRLSALPISVCAHVLGLTAVLVIPLLASDVLPQPPREELEWSVVPTAPTVPPPSPRRSVVATPVAIVNPDAAPLQAPAGIAPDDGLQRAVPEDAPEMRGGVVSGVVESGLNLGATVAEVAPPPSAPIRPGGDIREPQKLVNVQPLYPEAARAARVEGIVIIEAVIAPDGTVRDARVLRSRPLLDEAALHAVRQWRYTPTLLNGVPVPVIVTVTVNFRLQ